VTKTAQLSCLLQKEACVSNQRPTGDEALEANKRASEVRPERTNEGAKINRNEQLVASWRLTDNPPAMDIESTDAHYHTRIQTPPTQPTTRFNRNQPTNQRRKEPTKNRTGPDLAGPCAFEVVLRRTSRSVSTSFRSEHPRRDV